MQHSASYLEDSKDPLSSRIPPLGRGIMIIGYRLPGLLASKCLKKVIKYTFWNTNIISFFTISFLEQKISKFAVYISFQLQMIKMRIREVENFAKVTELGSG